MLSNSQNFTPVSPPLPQKHTSALQQKPQSTTKRLPLQPSPPNSQKLIKRKLGKYEFSIQQRIGSGAMGDVYVGINTQTFELVCIKVVDRAGLTNANQQQLLENEIRCQQLCSSQSTVRVYDIFDTPSFCFIVTQFCQGGDLYRFLKASPNGLPQALVIKFGKEIAVALKKLKDADIIHRDIKSQNILLQKLACKLGDFGFAIEAKKLTSQTKFNLGSPLYMSIQALQKSQYSFASDIFAYGAVLYQMLHKQSPWQCGDQAQLLNKLKTQDPSFKSGISQPLKNLINSCLSRSIQDRPTIQKILEEWNHFEVVQQPSCLHD